MGTGHKILADWNRRITTHAPLFFLCGLLMGSLVVLSGIPVQAAGRLDASGRVQQVSSDDRYRWWPKGRGRSDEHHNRKRGYEDDDDHDDDHYERYFGANYFIYGRQSSDRKASIALIWSTICQKGSEYDFSDDVISALCYRRKGMTQKIAYDLLIPYFQDRGFLMVVYLSKRCENWRKKRYECVLSNVEK